MYIYSWDILPPPLPLIPEILRLICENISLKSTLAALARTCRAFEYPALDVLWSDLDLEGFYPLAKCLPPHLWKEVALRNQGFGQITAAIVLRRALTSGDCVRLLRYAEKVQKFAFRQNTSTSKQVDISVLQGVQLAMQGAILLPNIRQLTWSSDKDENLPFIYMLMGPRLSYVDFSFRSDSIVPASLFPTLYDLCPSLKHVSFSFVTLGSNFKDDEKDTIQLISNSVSNMQNWQNLEVLCVPSLTSDALLRLSRLPTLRQLDLLRWRFGAVSPRVRTGGFPALNNVTIGTINALDCIPLLEMMDSSPIMKISLTFLKIQDAESYKRLFTAISEHCRHDTLKSFYSNDGHAERDTPSLPVGEPLNYESIKRLLVFRNLERLKMEVTRGFYLSDPLATKEMATSWTKIKLLTFYLPLMYRSQKQSTISLLDLLPFAEHCPNLVSLGLFFDASDPPSIDDQKPGNGVSQTALTDLYVGDSPAGFHIFISAFLSSCFPSLEAIETADSREVLSSDSEREDEEMGVNAQMWKSADELLWVFTGVRRQERLALM
ncbi:hypothetical protein BDQ17DRAFT_1542759 [Cyathus striatus]|nr:hypothetical protein BDQ17DRAFT_1542759 [Cyathus striatus]